MKRIIILAVVICLVVSSLTVFAQGSLTIKPLTNTIENSLFTDTNENDWYYPHLEILTNKKGIDGYPDGTFRPENNMSNAEFIKIVVALVSGELPKGSADGTHWADNYMNKAVELGLLTQDENVADRYDDPIIRQNMAKVVSRTMEKVFKEEKVADTSAYISKIVDWDGTCRLCKDDIAQAYAKGVIVGMPDGSFAGLKNATRAEATTMIVRLIDSSYRVKVIGNVVFNEKTDITVDGRMKAEKSKNYMDITLENLEFYKENEKYYVKCTFPELPQGFENWLTIGIERKNDIVITLTNLL